MKCLLRLSTLQMSPLDCSVKGLWPERGNSDASHYSKEPIINYGDRGEGVPLF